MEFVAVLNEGHGAVPTVANIAEVVSRVEIIDVDTFFGDDEVVGARAATTKEKWVVEGEGRCDDGSDGKGNGTKRPC